MDKTNKKSMIFTMNNNNKSTSTISSVKSKDNNSDETITKNTCVEEDGPRHIHACEIEVTFPTNLQAEQALQILRVDKEPTERVSKSFHLVKEKLLEKGGEDKRILDNNKTSNDTDHKVIHKMKV